MHNNNNEDLIELLLANGADVNITDGSGQTPLDLAQAEVRTEIVELLREYGAEE